MNVTTRYAGGHRDTENKKTRLSFSNDPAAAGEWVVENELSVTPRKALDSLPLFGHERSYIQSELGNPIYAAENPRITSNPLPIGLGCQSSSI